MRGDDGHVVDVDPGFDRAARAARRSKGDPADLDRARDDWEPTVCAGCGQDHPEPWSVRLKRAGSDVEARCSACGGLAARYSTGVWSS
ncbi:hypothetical protein [Nitrolancea hollandica]|uniref:Uncharacterized protein n=1 Tax=Nitrolancea hollandica Lb TaxID=1129897 RepID=I4EIF0_9BACT|nr:hypothetical protein [Nitrolancea hollandica]CCF84462.1 conserved hypothetical protein [Nitrolancea hollandica Lb]